MSEHEIAHINADIKFRPEIGHREIRTGDIDNVYNHEYVCSCGKTFGTGEAAYEHVTE